jgi:DNA-binding transcriptional MerR regulator
MKISEFAAAVGTDPPTIRFYEAEGVLPEPVRTDAGYRIYNDADVDRLRFVKQARALGLSLAEISEIATAREAGSPPCSYVRRLLSRQITNTKQQISELKQLLSELEALEAMSLSLPEQPGPNEACICHVIESSSLDETTGVSTKGN